MSAQAWATAALTGRIGGRRRLMPVALLAVTALLGLAAPALAAVTTVAPSAHDVRAMRWILIASMAVVLVLAVFPAKATRLVIGADGRWSTSKTTATIWTCLLGGSLLGIVIAKLADYPQALAALEHSGLAGQYGLLIGGPLGAAIAAKGIVGKQVEEKPAAKSPATSTSPAHLIQNDQGETDLGDFQYVLFNLVAMVFFVGTLIESPQAGLPHIPDVLLGLTSVSAVGYVAKKALPLSTPTAKLTAATAKSPDVIAITGTGLLDEAAPAATKLAVLLNMKQAGVESMATVNGTDSVKVAVPAGLAAGTKVDVVVVTSSGASLPAGSFSVVP
jgi:hypothetical protein